MYELSRRYDEDLELDAADAIEVNSKMVNYNSDISYVNIWILIQNIQYKPTACSSEIQG